MNLEKMKQASDLILQANALIKAEWDIDQTDDQAFGCYKALNAVYDALTETDDDRKDPTAYHSYYIISRLVEAVWSLSKHLKYDLRGEIQALKAMANQK